MKRISCLFLMGFVSLAALYAQTDKSSYYTAGSYEYGGITLPYRQLGLNQEKDGGSVLIVQLHGGTARGNDNMAQLNAKAVDCVENYLRSHVTKAIFLLPQCAADRVWNESSKSYDITMTEVLTQWLQQFIAENNIDTNRIYITGYSAGGSGAWRMVNDNTDLFASAVIAAANPIMVEAANVSKTPVYAVAGSNDNIMDANKIENFVTSLNSYGGNAIFDLLDGESHFGTCDKAFSKERLDWMFQYQRSSSTSVVGLCPDENRSDEEPFGIYTLTGMKTTGKVKGLHLVKYSDGQTKKCYF